MNYKVKKFVCNFFYIFIVNILFIIIFIVLFLIVFRFIDVSNYGYW